MLSRLNMKETEMEHKDKEDKNILNILKAQLMRDYPQIIGIVHMSGQTTLVLFDQRRERPQLPDIEETKNWKTVGVPHPDF